MSKPSSYAEAPKEIRDSVEQLIRDFGSDPALLAGAIVSATTSVIAAAKEEERISCARIADERGRWHIEASDIALPVEVSPLIAKDRCKVAFAIRDEILKRGEG